MISKILTKKFYYVFKIATIQMLIFSKIESNLWKIYKKIKNRPILFNTVINKYYNDLLSKIQVNSIYQLKLNKNQIYK